MQAQMSDSVQRIGDYLLLNQIGSGLIGSVYRAQKIEHIDDSGSITTENKDYVLRLLGPEFSKDAAYRKLFIKEATKCISLHHAGIASLRDVVIDPDHLALISDYIKGRPLSEKIPKNGYTLIEALDILEPIAESLDLFHRNKVVHGNITPHNILIDRRGQPILLDMGLCKDASWMNILDKGAYRAPEQLRDSVGGHTAQVVEGKVMNPATDRYSFGLLVFKLLGGSLPWDAGLKDENLLPLKETDRLLTLSTFVPRIDVELLAGVMQMISADPKKRLPFCMDLIELLEEAIANQEQTADIPKVPKEVLEKAKADVLELDQKIMHIEKKVTGKKEKIAKMRQKMLTSIEEAEQKFQEALQPRRDQITAQQQRLEKLKLTTNTMWFRIAKKMAPERRLTRKQEAFEVAEENHLQAAQVKVFGSVELVRTKDNIILFLIFLVLGLMATNVFGFVVNPSAVMAFFIIDLLCCIVFIANFIFEYHHAKSKRWYWRRHWIDLVGSIPLPPVTFSGNATVLRFARAFRLIRALRFVSALRQFKSKYKNLKDEIEEIQKVMREEEEKRREEYQDAVAKAKKSFAIVQEKAFKEIEPLEDERYSLEEQLMELGEIHPKLLGFRAKKNFSRADVKVGEAVLEMILLPRGNFMMGSSLPDADEDEKPKHRVVLKNSFWIGTLPVSQALYRSTTGKNPSRFQDKERPVETVTWYDAIRFCNALSLREDLTPAYVIDSDDETNVRWERGANGYRLPTEAEWEYAAKANGGSYFAGSEDPEEVAWYDTNSGDSTQKMGLKMPNPWGLFDMSGNVWEWCWDFMGAYPRGAETDPMGPSEGTGRIFRGGSWIVDENRLRITCRGRERPTNRFDGIGFRIVRNSR